MEDIRTLFTFPEYNIPTYLQTVRTDSTYIQTYIVVAVAFGKEMDDLLDDYLSVHT
jgi:hypothetical protein